MKVDLDPTLTLEQTYWDQGFDAVAGIDEVGRGCVAGPVVAAAVIFPPGHQPISGINDSKKLTSRQREVLYPQIYSQATAVGIGRVEAPLIDTKGIVAATSLAMLQACAGLSPEVICVDGPFLMTLDTICSQVLPVIKGDQKVYSIAAASIIAKVHRDNIMKAYADSYPVFGWEKNKGYGTKHHFESIKKHGLTVLHRKSFISWH